MDVCSVKKIKPWPYLGTIKDLLLLPIKVRRGRGGGEERGPSKREGGRGPFKRERGFFFLSVLRFLF